MEICKTDFILCDLDLGLQGHICDLNSLLPSDPIDNHCDTNEHSLLKQGVCVRSREVSRRKFLTGFKYMWP